MSNQNTKKAFRSAITSIVLIVVFIILKSLANAETIGINFYSIVSGILILCFSPTQHHPKSLPNSLGCSPKVRKEEFKNFFASVVNLPKPALIKVESVFFNDPFISN